MPDEKWVVIDEVAGELQAEILRGFLEAQEIPVWASQEGAGRVYALGIGDLGRVQLLVPSSYVEKARLLLDDYYTGKLATEEPFEVDERDVTEEEGGE